jgi:DNA polymerase-3 subunit epsilon
MAEAARFVGDAPMVAHNASFDRRYWQAELALCGLPAQQPFACTVLLSRRLYPEAPSHKLGSLVDRFNLPRTGQAHRALADAEMATELLGRIRHDLLLRHGIARPDHAFLCALQSCSKASLPKFFARQASVALA